MTSGLSEKNLELMCNIDEYIRLSKKVDRMIIHMANTYHLIDMYTKEMKEYERILARMDEDPEYDQFYAKKFELFGDHLEWDGGLSDYIFNQKLMKKRSLSVELSLVKTSLRSNKDSFKELKEKVDKLIEKLGSNYIN